MEASGSAKKIDVSKWLVVLGFVFIALVGIRTVSTPEIWTHLANAQTNAPLTQLAADNPVNETWMYDKLAAGLWNAGGAPALILFNALCLAGTFVLLAQVAGKWGGPISQTFALLIAGHLLFRGVDVDPQILGILFLAFFVNLLSFPRKPAMLFGALIPAQLLWTNLHGSFLFGPFIALLATLQAVQENKGRKKSGVQADRIRALGILTFVLLLSTLANPSFFRLHAQVLTNVGRPAPVYWSSLMTSFYHPASQKPLILFLYVLGAAGLITLKKRLPLMLTTLAVLGALLVGVSSRNSILFAALAYPFVVLSFSAVGDYLLGSMKNLLAEKSALLSPAMQIVSGLLILLSIFQIVRNKAYVLSGSASSFGLGAEEHLYPAGEAADLLFNHPAFPKEKIANLPPLGGYLAWKYGCTPMLDYRPGRYDPDFLLDLNAMMRGDKKAYDKIFDRYRPDAIVVDTLMPSASQTISTLLTREGFVWGLVYFDGSSAVLMQRKAKFLPIFRNKDIQQGGLDRLEAARRKYADALERGKTPGNPAELIGAAKVYLALNRPNEAAALFDLILKGNRRVPGAWLGLGTARLMQKRFDESMSCLETATRLAPDSLLAWDHYAAACRYAGKTNEEKQAVARIDQLRTRLLEEQAKEKKKAESTQVDETPIEETTNPLGFDVPTNGK